MKSDVTQIKDTSKIKYIVKGIIFSYLIAIALIFIYSIVLSYTNISDQTIPNFVIGISLVSVLMSSVIFCKQIGTNGLYNGGIIGLAYIMIIYFLSSFFKVGFSLDKYSILMILVCIATGCIGGILGVNFNKNIRG